MDDMQHQNEQLLGQVRRALFWQDVISSLVTTSPRLLSREEHYKGTRVPDLCVLPPGFRPVIPFWSAKFAGVLEDLNALCLLVDVKYNARQAPRKGLPDVVLMAELDDEGYPTSNRQSDIESRVVDLLCESRRVQTLNDPIYQACLFAAYLCTYRLSAGLWERHFVAERCVVGILDNVAISTYDDRWESIPGLLLWLLFKSGKSSGPHSALLLYTLEILS
ncbi:Nn.00g006110.m01.CDS01 [Neocucurbitaria sp. VM-36]